MRRTSQGISDHNTIVQVRSYKVLQLRLEEIPLSPSPYNWPLAFKQVNQIKAFKKEIEEHVNIEKCTEYVAVCHTAC